MTTNAIALSRGFVEAGIERKAADAIAEAMTTHSDETFATKADLASFATKEDIADFATKADLTGFATKADLRREIAELKAEMIKWVIGINFTAATIIIAVIKLL